MTIYKDQLEAVYALIEKPERWCQKAVARDSNGVCVDPNYPDARQWCIEGACKKVTGESHFSGLYNTLGCDGWQFNDTHTHAEVLALLKSAIERAPVRP